MHNQPTPAQASRWRISHNTRGGVSCSISWKPASNQTKQPTRTAVPDSTSSTQAGCPSHILNPTYVKMSNLGLYTSCNSPTSCIWCTCLTVLYHTFRADLPSVVNVCFQKSAPSGYLGRHIIIRAEYTSLYKLQAVGMFSEMPVHGFWHFIECLIVFPCVCKPGRSECADSFQEFFSTHSAQARGRPDLTSLQQLQVF